jgi:SH3-like domain-containing protein
MTGIIASLRRLSFGFFAIGITICLAGTIAAAADPVIDPPGPATKPGSGLPIPRFVSLKSDKVNLRSGPGTEYPATWVYRRAGLPVEVTAEFDAWRKVRDAEGVTGWVLNSLLSGRRTALVLPWEVKADQPLPQIPVRMSDSERAKPVVIVEAGVIANVHACDGTWCQITVDAYRGYIEQKKLWGVYEGERLE